MKKKYKQTYKSKRQDYRKGGRVQKAKGGVNTRSVEPDDRLNKTVKPPERDTQSISEPISKPVIPPVLTKAGIIPSLLCGSGTMFAKSIVGVPGLDVGKVKTCLSAVPPKRARLASPASSLSVGALATILPV